MTAEALIVASDRTHRAGSDAGQRRLLGEASVLKRTVRAMRQGAEAEHAIFVMHLDDTEAREAAKRIRWPEPDFLPPTSFGGAICQANVRAGFGAPIGAAPRIALIRNAARLFTLQALWPPLTPQSSFLLRRTIAWRRHGRPSRIAPEAVKRLERKRRLSAWE
jgi:hypothetical protein